MEAELESYQFQLSQVSSALQDDPGNSELSSLKTELEEIISLTKQALGMHAGGSQAAGSSAGLKGKSKDLGPSTIYKALRAGDECSAKYKDGKWYPAKITAVAGSSDSPVYTIIFHGYSNTTTLPASGVRATSSTSSTSAAAQGVSLAATVEDEDEEGDQLARTGKRKLTAAEEEREKEKKKKKLEKYKEGQKAKVQETIEKRTAWQSFGKKAAKKGVKIGGLEGKSIFRTPDNPMGKVGVVGSGQGVTAYEQRGKHVFDKGEGPSGK